MHEIRKTDDGAHAITDEHGRVATLNLGGSLRTGDFIDTAAEAKSLAQDAGVEIKGESRAQGARTSGSGGAARAAKKSGARRS